MLRGASGSQCPWGYTYLSGAVPAGTLVPIHGSHLHKQATEDLQANGRGGAAPTSFMIDHLQSNPKTTLRRQSALARAEASGRLGASAGAALAATAAMLALPAGAVVAGYWPLGDEIDPRPLMAALAGRGHALALPVVAGPGEALAFRAWTPGDALEAGGHGTRHPPAGAADLVPSVVLTPLLAFDRRGLRLGYGGGYYDRTLARLRHESGVIAIGLAFAAQEVPLLPADPWDLPLDMIITECGVIAVERA